MGYPMGELMGRRHYDDHHGGLSIAQVTMPRAIQLFSRIEKRINPMKHSKLWLRNLMASGMIIAALAGVTACQTPPETPAATEETEETTDATTEAADTEELTTVRFTLSWLLQGVDAPLTLAIERGYFEEEGLDLQFERGYGSADTASKIAAGQYDIGFGDMYSMIEFNEQNPDDQLIVVAVPYNKAPFAIVTDKESGIESVQDLEGRTLGAPAGDAPRRLWPVLAEASGIDPDSVEWVTMEPKLRETFLLQGNVDGISGFIYSMMPSLIAGGKTEEDLNIFYYKDNGLDFYGNVVMVRKDFLEGNEEMVSAFLRAYVRGIQDMMMDPEAGLESVMAAGDELMDREAEKLRLQIALDNLLINEEVEELGIGTVDPERLEATIAQTVKGFGLANTPAIEDVFTAEYLPPLEDRLLPDDRQPLE
jgi:NitT/TauT family transport system substrate-binding protein